MASLLCGRPVEGQPVSRGEETAARASSPVIEMLLSGRDVRTRIQAALALSRIRTPGGVEALCRALSDRSATVRSAAAESLRTLGDPSALSALRARREDRDRGVRRTVARAIAALAPGSPGASEQTASGSASGAQGGARYALRVVPLSNGADDRDEVLDALRAGLERELVRIEGVALVEQDGSTDADRNAGTFAVEASVRALRRWQVASTTHARADVALVLVTDPARTIVASVSGSSTAQEGAVSDAPSFDLDRRAIDGAIRRAVATLGGHLSSRR